MFNSVMNQPDLRPFQALTPNVDLKATNTVAAWGAKIKFKFAKEDEADDLLLNEVIWRSVRGAKHPMPAPVRAGFVMTDAARDDD